MTIHDSSGLVPDRDSIGPCLTCPLPRCIYDAGTQAGATWRWWRIMVDLQHGRRVPETPRRVREAQRWWRDEGYPVLTESDADGCPGPLERWGTGSDNIRYVNPNEH